MSLPISWIEKIFAKLTVGYGVEFMGRYKGLSLSDVKTDWSEELSGLGGPSIAYALEHLPERAPTAMQFKSICLLAPAPYVPQLPAPKIDMERVAAEIAKFDAVRAYTPTVDFKAWAKAIIASPEGRTPTVVQMAKNALRTA